MPVSIITIVGTNRAEVELKAKEQQGKILYANYKSEDEVEEYRHLGFKEMTGARSENAIINHYEEGKTLFVAVVKY
jgi:hypothetical protein